MGNNSELLDIVDKNDKVINVMPRSLAHGNPAYIHRVAHVLVFNTDGDIFLQKRGLTKDVQPGKWDTSVGGHLDSGEDYEIAARREMAEELGIKNLPLNRLYKYLHSNDYESEYVTSFSAVWDGPFSLQSDEIDDGRFWSFEEIEQRRSEAIFTPNFLEELSRYLKHVS